MIILGLHKLGFVLQPNVIVFVSLSMYLGNHISNGIVLVIRKSLLNNFSVYNLWIVLATSNIK